MSLNLLNKPIIRNNATIALFLITNSFGLSVEHNDINYLHDNLKITYISLLPILIIVSKILDL